MTIHGSKGLEFDNVFILGLQEGVFPGKHCVTADAMEEERRLFYVAMTRCRKHLFLVGRRKTVTERGNRDSWPKQVLKTILYEFKVKMWKYNKPCAIIICRVVR